MTKKVKTFIKTRLESADRTSPRGDKYQLYIERVNENIRKLSFSIRIINTRNSLPREVAKTPSISTFKNRLDTYPGATRILSSITKPRFQQKECGRPYL